MNAGRKVGTLVPGKEADLLMLKADSIDIWPLNNVYGSVVGLMGPSHVEAVFIAGQVRKWQGSLVGVDTARLIAMVERSRNEVLRRGNFTANLLGFGDKYVASLVEAQEKLAGIKIVPRA